MKIMDCITSPSYTHNQNGFNKQTKRNKHVRKQKTQTNCTPLRNWKLKRWQLNTNPMRESFLSSMCRALHMIHAAIALQ